MIHRVDLVAEKLDAKRFVSPIYGIDVHHVAVYAKVASVEVVIVSLVAHIDELLQ